MEEDRDVDGGRFSDNWLGNWEDSVISDFEQQTNMADCLQSDRDETARKLFLAFQHSAACAAQLYKDRHQGLSLWIPFQNAASSVTRLYKDSSESVKRAYELGIQCGHQKRTRDILSWAKKRRRHIRREDLIAYLCNRNAPVRHKPPTPMSRASTRGDRASPLKTTGVDLPLEATAETDLQPFRDALDLHGLNGAMSNVSVGFHQNSAGFDSDLNIFIMNEFTRHNERKRTSSPTDVIMDSPTRKRSRLF